MALLQDPNGLCISCSELRVSHPVARVVEVLEHAFTLWESLNHRAILVRDDVVQDGSIREHQSSIIDTTKSMEYTTPKYKQRRLAESNQMKWVVLVSIGILAQLLIEAVANYDEVVFQLLETQAWSGTTSIWSHGKWLCRQHLCLRIQILLAVTMLVVRLDWL